jgi:hypothetical protein
MNNNILRYIITYNVSLNNEIINNLYLDKYLITSYSSSLKNIIEITTNILSDLISRTSMLDYLYISLDYDSSMFISPIIIAFLRCNTNRDGEYSFLNHKLEISFGNLSLFKNGKISI